LGGAKTCHNQTHAWLARLGTCMSEGFFESDKNGRPVTATPIGHSMGRSQVRRYQTDEASANHQLKWNIRRTYDQVLDTIERAFAQLTLAALKINDF
jgi:hypothetical protein